MIKVKKVLSFALLFPFLLTGCSAAELLGIEEEKPVKTTKVDAKTPLDLEPDGALNDVVSVGDWEIKMVNVNKNANEIIAETNEFNRDPVNTFMMVEFDVTYRGEERHASAFMDVMFSFTATDNTMTGDVSVVTPDVAGKSNTEQAKRVRPNGTVKMVVVFDVDPTLVSGGIIEVEAYDETNGGESEYALIIVE